MSYLIPKFNSFVKVCLSSSYHAASIHLPDPLSPPVSIIHCSQEVFKAISCIGTELLYIDSSRSSCLCSSIWRSAQEYVTYEFVPTSPAVSHMSGSSNFDSFHDCHTAAILYGVASRTCSILLAAFLCNCHQTFSLYV